MIIKHSQCPKCNSQDIEISYCEYSDLQEKEKYDKTSFPCELLICNSCGCEKFIPDDINYLKIHLKQKSTCNGKPLIIVDQIYRYSKPHAFPCKLCGGYNIIVDSSQIPYHIVECRECHFETKISMEDYEVEFYTNVYLKNIQESRKFEALWFNSFG